MARSYLLRFTLVAALWCLALPSAAQEPASCEQDVESAFFTPLQGDHGAPAWASDGKSVLVAWQDDGEIRVALLEPDTGLRGTRVGGIANGNPDVVFDGTHYLVIWPVTTTLMGRRIDSDFDFVDATATTVLDFPDAVAGGEAAIATDGQGQLAVAYQQKNTGHLALQRLTTQGAGFPLPDGPSSTYDLFSYPVDIDVAFGKQKYLVSWRAFPTGDIRARWIDRNGVSTNSVTVRAGPGNRAPSVAFDGNNHWLTYSDGTGADLDVYGALMMEGVPPTPQFWAGDPGFDDIAGELDGGKGGLFLTFTRENNVAFDGIFGSEFPGGVGPMVVDKMGGSGDFDRPVSVVLDNQLVALFERKSGLEILGEVFQDAGAGFILSAKGNNQTLPAVGHGDGGHVAVWTDDREGGEPLQMARLDAQGLLQGDTVTVNQDFFRPLGPSAVARNGNGYLVAFVAGTSIFDQSAELRMVRYDQSLAFVDALPPIGAGFRPQLQPLPGGDTLLVWEQSDGDCALGKCFYDNFRVHAMVVHADGSTTTIGQISPPDETTVEPAVAVSETGLAVVVWRRQLFTDPGDILGVVLDLSGSDGPMLLGPFPVALGPEQQSEPDVAVVGGRALVVWEDERNGGHEIWGRHVPIPPDDVEPALGRDFNINQTTEGLTPQVAPAGDGYNYVVVWKGSAAGAAFRPRAAWVPIEPGEPPFPLTGVALTQQGEVDRLALSEAGDGKVLLGLSAGDPTLNALRFRACLLPTAAADGSACGGEENIVCASGVCEDGFCCPAPCGTCERCSETGICEPVTNAIDPNTCEGDLVCSADGVCGTARGEACEDDAACASGHCVDGVCCNQACDGVCATCDTGTCEPSQCGLYGCDEEKVCYERCDSSEQCTPGFQCRADGTCASPDDLTPTTVGCGCRQGAAPPSDRPWWLLALPLLALFRRRRRS